MSKLLLYLISDILALFLAVYLIPGIYFLGDLKTLLVAGLIMGLINFFIKPALKAIAFPLKFLTLGLSSLIINLGLVWLVIGVLFRDSFVVTTWLAYLWTFLLIFFLNMILISNKKK